MFLDETISGACFNTPRGFLLIQLFTVILLTPNSSAQLDTDPIDLAASSNEVSILKHVIPYNEELLCFSDRAQFKVEATEATYSPTSTGITLSTRFQHDPNVEPVGAGNYIYFAQAKGA